MPALFMAPGPDWAVSSSPSGIQQIVKALGTRLPDFGWEFVAREEADLTVGHAFASIDPDVVHCHGLYPTSILEAGWYFKANAQVVEAVRQAQKVTVPSPWVARLFEREMGFRPVVLPHGIDLSEWPERSDPCSSLVIWNKNRPSDMCTPRPLEVLARCRSDVRFVSTFGEARGNLRVTGLVSHRQMKRMLYGSSVFFAPTKETFGIGTLEALAAGLPVLAWNWGHTPEIVRHKVEGYLAEPEDHRDTSEGLTYCLDNWKRLSSAARSRALEFDWGEVIPRYDRLYRDVLEPFFSPLVTVVIPCYNYAAFVKEAIDSVKDQTFQDWECFVIDDGSIDDSLDAIRASVADDYRFYVLSQQNKGVAAARNRGAHSGKGEYLCFLDADDQMVPELLETLVAPLEEDRSLGVVYGSLVALREGQAHESVWPPQFSLEAQLAGKNQVPTCCLIRRKAFLGAGGYRQRLHPAEDAELWTRIALQGWQIRKVTERPVFVYRFHGKSASSVVRMQQKPEPDWRAWLSGANGGPRPFPCGGEVREYDRPEVSIVVPVGEGHEDLLLEALDSVAAQTFPFWEVIVVDDTDRGALREWGPIPYGTVFPYVRWLRDGSHNVSHARNVGAGVAKGKFLLFLDADDLILKDFLKATLPVAKRWPSMVYTDWIRLPEGKFSQAEPYSFTWLMHRALFPVTFLHPRSAWEEVGGFDEGIPGWEDWDYTIALAVLGLRGVKVDGPLFGYRTNSGSRREEHLSRQSELIAAIRLKWNPELLIQQWKEAQQKELELKPRLIEVQHLTHTEDLIEVPGSGNRYRFPPQRKLVVGSDAPFFAELPNFVVRWDRGR